MGLLGETLRNLRAVFKLELSDADIALLEANNSFFLGIGILSIEIATRSPAGFPWSTFKEYWWTRVAGVELSYDRKLAMLRLAYVAYITRSRGTYDQLPAPVRGLHLEPRCAFPSCARTDDLQQDHVWPRSLGGPDKPWNLQNLCGAHNRMKSNFPGLNFCDPSLLLSAVSAGLPP